MSFENLDLSGELKEKFAPLLKFYDSLGKHLKEVYPAQYNCNDCNKCCCYPYYYLILYTPEFDLVQAYIEETGMPCRVQFERLVSRKLDRRVYHKNWICPMYDFSSRGCSVYPVRPFSCRVFGPYSTKEGQIEGCVYKDQIIYNYTDDLAFWNGYVDAIRSFPDPIKGYILPDSMLWQYPVVEMLMETDLPFGLSKNYDPASLTFEEVEKRLGYSTAAKFEGMLRDYEMRGKKIEGRYKEL